MDWFMLMCYIMWGALALAFIIKFIIVIIEIIN